MLTFRNTSIFFLLLLAGLIVYDVQNGLQWWIYLIIVLIYSLILFWGSYFVHSNFYIKIVCKADTGKKEIAISFDDGPAENFTPEILSVLKEQDAPATFFCIGNRIKGNESIFQRVYNDGHLIGNHSYSHHLWFDLFSRKKMSEDLQQMDEEMKRVIGVKPKLFRPPYGVTNPNLSKAIKLGDYIPIGWNIRSMDTVIKDEQKLFEKVTGAIEPGSVVLFHDTSKATLNILPAFLKKVREEGYTIVRLDKLLNLTPYA